MTIVTHLAVSKDLDWLSLDEILAGGHQTTLLKNPEKSRDRVPSCNQSSKLLIAGLKIPLLVKVSKVSVVLSMMEMQVRFGLAHGKSFEKILGAFQKLAPFGLIFSPIKKNCANSTKAIVGVL